MHKCSIFTFEEKLNAVLTNLSGMMGIKSLSKKLKCNPSNIQLWIAQYKTFGENGLKNNLTNLKYSQEVKLKAVNEYISGKISLSEICIKYKIRSTTQLRKWISLYNNNEVLKSRGGMSVRTKGIRKNLSFKDRIEIVKYYLEISNDFAETAVKFQVSYQQVYQWVHKYNKFGVDGLIDRRGKRKPKDELTEVERLQLENKLLKAKNRRIELENAFLKKLNELGRSVILNPFKHHSIYLTIKEIKDKYNASIKELCEIAGIARSAYYKWLKKYKDVFDQTFNHIMVILI